MTATLRRNLSALLGVALAVAFVGGLIVLVLNSGGENVPAPLAIENEADETPSTTPPDSGDESPVTTISHAQSLREEYATSSFYPGGEGKPLPPMGIANTEYDWAVAELVESVDGEMWLSQLFQFNGQLWAMAAGWDHSSDGPVSRVFTSADGVVWNEIDAPVSDPAFAHGQFTATDAGLIGIINIWNPSSEQPEVRVVSTIDGVAWNETDLSSQVAADEHLWISMTAAGDGVIVLTGAVEPTYDRSYQPPDVVIEKGGYVITLMESSWTYSVVDAASGEVVAQGSQESIFVESESGLPGIYTPDGTKVATIDWEKWHNVASDAYANAQPGERLIIELETDGVTVSLDEFSKALTVTDDGGTVLFEGTINDLWQGRPPTFTHANTGEVLVSVSWEEWEQAYADAYESLNPERGAYYARPLVLRSEDGGVTWDEVDVSSVTDDGFFFQGLAYGPGGFLAIGVSEGAFVEGDIRPATPPRPELLRSPDGLVWARASTDLGVGSWMHSLTSDGSAFYAVAGDESGSRVLRSVDGSSWQTFLSVDDLNLELGTVWFDKLIATGGGTLATGSYDGGAFEYDTAPASVSISGRTMTFDEGTYTVTDDATGAVLFEASEDDFYHEEPGFGSEQPGLRWGEGGLAFFADDGTLIMAVPQREFDLAMEAAYSEPAEYYEGEQFAVLVSGDAVTRVALPDDLGRSWISAITGFGDKVAIASISELDEGGSYRSVGRVLTGSPTA